VNRKKGVARILVDSIDEKEASPPFFFGRRFGRLSLSAHRCGKPPLTKIIRQLFLKDAEGL
jgi:hypothetical protein